MHVEFRPVKDEVDSVCDWTNAVPTELLDHWRASHSSQVRTLCAALDDGGRPRAVGLEVHRPMTAYAKLLPVWSEDPAAEAELIHTVEERAWSDGAVVVKREFDSTPPPVADYHDISAPTTPAPPLRAGRAAPHGQVCWRGTPPSARLPYYRQTTDITCGPVATLTAMAGLGLVPELTREDELAVWREATTMDGCDPLGLALAAERRGAQLEVYLSTDEAILLELAQNDDQRELRRFIQDGFRKQAAKRGLPVHHRAFTLDDLDTVIDDGGIGVVLIDELGMHPESCPHWVAVHSRDRDVYYAQDPWTSDTETESWLDAHQLPVPRSALDRLAWYGKPAVRSMLAIRKP